MKHVSYLLSSVLFISFLVRYYDGEVQMSQTTEKQLIQTQSKQENQSNKPKLTEWQEKLLEDLHGNYVPLSHSVLIPREGIKKIEIFLINSAIAPQVPQGADNIRRNVLEAKQDVTHPHYGSNSNFAYYQLSENTYPKVIEFINSIHATPFDNFVNDLEDKYRNRTYRDYRLLIEIQYHNQEKVEILTTQVLSVNFLLARIVQNQQSHYLVMDNKDMDMLMKYVDPKITTWEWARPYI